MVAWMTGGQLLLRMRSCPTGEEEEEKGGCNPNCHLAGHANEMKNSLVILIYCHLPGTQLQDRGGGASDLGDKPTLPVSVHVSGSCRQ